MSPHSRCATRSDGAPGSTSHSLHRATCNQPSSSPAWHGQNKPSISPLMALRFARFRGRHPPTIAPKPPLFCATRTCPAKRSVTNPSHSTRHSTTNLRKAHRSPDSAYTKGGSSTPFVQCSAEKIAHRITASNLLRLTDIECALRHLTVRHGCGDVPLNTGDPAHEFQPFISSDLYHLRVKRIRAGGSHRLK